MVLSLLSLYSARQPFGCSYKVSSSITDISGFLISLSSQFPALYIYICFYSFYTFNNDLNGSSNFRVLSFSSAHTHLLEQSCVEMLKLLLKRKILNRILPLYLREVMVRMDWVMLIEEFKPSCYIICLKWVFSARNSCHCQFELDFCIF